MPKYDDYNNRERKKLSQKRNSGYNGKFSQKHIRVQIEIQNRERLTTLNTKASQSMK